MTTHKLITVNTCQHCKWRDIGHIVICGRHEIHSSYCTKHRYMFGINFKHESEISGIPEEYIGMAMREANLKAISGFATTFKCNSDFEQAKADSE